MGYHKYVDEAEKARREERERCAKIAEEYELPDEEELLERGYDAFDFDAVAYAQFEIADRIRGEEK